MSEQKTVVVPVILCGGSGTRLWPASRENHPKQFLSLMDDFSLLQNTMKRAIRTAKAEAANVVTVTLGTLATEVARQLSELDDVAAQHILCEPSARNTAAAVAYAASYVERVFGSDAIMWILPADHHIGDEDNLAASFGHALKSAQDGNLVTFGIRPTRPDTGYGYIQLGKNFGDIAKAQRFVEKPNRDTAQSYLDAGNFLWNSRMFLFSADAVLAEYAIYAPEILRVVNGAMQASGDIRVANPDLYAAVEKQPFDVSIMEKSDKVMVVPCNPAWSDIGSWESLWDIREKDANGNVTTGRAACFETKNCLVQAQDRLIACAGVEDLVVIETADALLIANRTNADAMRVLVSGLKKSGAREVIDPPSAQQQPWSLSKTMGGGNSYSVHEIEIRPGENLAFPPHADKGRFWTVVEGHSAVAIIGEDRRDFSLHGTAFIPAGVAYGVVNTGKDGIRIVEMVQSEQAGVRFSRLSGQKAVA